MTEKTISAEQVAILAERVDTLLNNHSKIEGLILGISAQQTALAGSVAVFQERLSNMEGGQRRLFELADDQGKELEHVMSDVKVHSWTWKLVGVTALASLGLVGWAFSELRALQITDNRHDNRLAILEFVVGGRNPPKPIEGTKP